MKKSLVKKIKQCVPSNAEEMIKKEQCKKDVITYCMYISDLNCPKLCYYSRGEDLSKAYTEKQR